MRHAGVLSSVGLGVTAALAVGTALPAQAASRPAQPGTATHWRVVYSHRTSVLEGFWAVVTAGAHEVWALGGQPGGGSPSIAAHARNGRWKAASLPKGVSSAVENASGVSASDVWASTASGQVLHWNGAKWRIVRNFTPAGQLGQLSGLTAFGPDNVWVFGASGESRGDGTWHLYHHRWHKVTGLAAGLVSASAVSATDMWAVGPGVGPGDLIHYNGHGWRGVHYRALSRIGLSGVVATRHDLWVLGTAGTRQVIMHRHGSKWSRISTPRSGLFGLASDGAGGLWAQSSGGTGTSYLLHLKRSGRWASYTFGSYGGGISDVARIPGTGGFLGAGIQVQRNGRSSATIWRLG